MPLGNREVGSKDQENGRKKYLTQTRILSQDAAGTLYITDMATAPVIPQVSVEDYEMTPVLFERYEYVDGLLTPRSRPTRKHSLLQGWLAFLFYQHYSSLVHGPELHSKISNTGWRIPDYAVWHRQAADDQQYAYAPLLLTIEIRSPDDRWSEMLRKFEDYHEWGVPFCWLFDPEHERAWTYHRGEDFNEVTAKESILAGEIELALAEVFSVLHGK